MSIKIEQLLPLLKKGWVAMDEGGEWYWYRTNPFIIDGDNSWTVITANNYRNLSAFDIEPLKDWTQSLMECGK